MAYNKFITADGLVLLDLTADTVTANNLAKGIIAHDKSGAVIEGLYEVEEWDGSGVVIEALASTGLITFTINGTEYQAEDGMTWAEFVDSEYNPDTGYTNRPKKFTTIGITGVGYAWDEYNTFLVREPNSYYDEVTTNVIKPIEYESYNPSSGGGVN